MLSIMFSLTSCATVVPDDIYMSSTPVYYDYVVTGFVDGPNYIYDGTYSYHIVGSIPLNCDWVLYPYTSRVILYNTSMVYVSVFRPSSSWIYYNGHRYHHFHKPPHKPNHTYRPPQPPPHKPGGTVRPPQPNNRGKVTPPKGNNHRQPTTRPSTRPSNPSRPSGGHVSPPTRNHNSGGGHRGRR